MSRPVSFRTLGCCAGGLAALLLLRLAGAAPEAPPAPEKTFTAEEVSFFEKEVRPLLEARCVRCHGGEKVRGGLRLTTRAGLLKGGELGPAFSPEKPEESRILQAVHFGDSLKMPPSGKLPDKEIAVLERWVRMGAPWSPAGKEIVKGPTGEGGKVTPEARNYWAYRPVQHVEPPAVKGRDWVRNPIDAFLLAKMEEKGLAPVGPADRVALIRRVTYDLIGLPPTPEEVDSFVNDRAPDAYEKLVDRLLASPHYGEKWGRHWLDLVRYAETNGYERDNPKPFAWRYRDYVIAAFNSDKPYDQFIREQLAGDELDEVTAETLTATGYYRLGIWDDEPADRLLARYDVLDGITSTTGQVFLGMTVGCARCHDHKKDPIPQRDYYRLLAFFQDVTEMNGKNTRKVATEADRREQAKLLKEKADREATLYQRVYALEQRFAHDLAEKKGLRAGRGGSDLVDLRYRFYRDTWDKLPSFEGLKPEAEGTISGGLFTLAPASRAEAIGLVFEGKLQVPQNGTYKIRVRGTEGVRLWLDGAVVLDRPGRGVQEGEVTATMPARPVPIRLEYFNTTERPQLSVSWSGPGFTDRPLSEDGGERVLAADSRQAGQTWSYTLAAPEAGWTKADFKETGWKQGHGGFGTRGTPGAVVRTVWNTQDIWLRRSFRVEEVPTSLALDLHHDDDVEVFLNGVPVYSAPGYLVKYDRLPLGPEAVRALKKGDNVLAVHCHQTSGGQYIDVGLVEGGARLSLQALVQAHGKEILGAEDYRTYRGLVAELEASRQAKLPEVGLEVMCVEERGRAPTHVLIRGNPAAQGELVEPGFPEVLTPKPVKVPQREPTAPTSGRRRALADWLTSPANPLTARVMANRLWQFHFGRAIVPTPNDFGKLGEQPTHPELLDWLANDFVAGGWKVKRMHKLILTSSAYRMAATATPEGLRLDPGNQLFWRFNPRRLTAEEVRDSILAVSGQLSLKAGGPSVYPPIPKEVLAGQSVPGSGWGKSTQEEASRRSVYVHVKRSLLVPILATHDQADTDSSCAVRYTTTVPTQALGMLNGAFTNEQAAFFAERLRREVGNDPAAQVRRVIRLTTGRQPGEEEVKRDLAFLRELQTKAQLTETEALRRYCLLALNTNEFVYLD